MTRRGAEKPPFSLASRAHFVHGSHHRAGARCLHLQNAADRLACGMFNDADAKNIEH
jgi:hypothetical protein